MKAASIAASQTMTVARAHVVNPEMLTPSKNTSVTISPINTATRATLPRSAGALVSAIFIINGSTRTWTPVKISTATMKPFHSMLMSSRISVGDEQAEGVGAEAKERRDQQPDHWGVRQLGLGSMVEQYADAALGAWDGAPHAEPCPDTPSS